VDRQKQFLSEIISRLNSIFGDVSDTEHQRHFTNHIVGIAESQPEIREQVQKNTKEQAMNGDLPDVVTKTIVEAMRSHDALAKTLLRDEATRQAFVSLVYDITKMRIENPLFA